MKKIATIRFKKGDEFIIEKLPVPIKRGAQWRYYKLHRNGEPCFGFQYHHDLEQVYRAIEFVGIGTLHGRIQLLQTRVRQLEQELELCTGGSIG